MRRPILGETAWRQSRERIAPLAHVAQAKLDRLRPIVGLWGCCVLLADAEGVAIEWRAAPGDEADLRRMALVPGAIWNEETGGTNGIGTCLVERRPLAVQGEQHFFASNGAISCVAAPVFDHLRQLAAVLNISVYGKQQDGALLGYARLVAREAAREIEDDHFRQCFSRARILLLGEEHRRGLIAVDADDLIVGASMAARSALRISDLDIAHGLVARDVLEGTISSHTDLDDAQRAALRRALARTKGNVSRAASELGLSRATVKRKLRQFKVNPRIR